MSDNKEQHYQEAANAMCREASAEYKSRQAAEDEAHAQQQKVLEAKLAAARARRDAAKAKEQQTQQQQENTKDNTNNQNMTPKEALALLRKWKEQAYNEAQQDPMTLENPDWETEFLRKKNVVNKYKDWSYLQSALQPGTKQEAELAWTVIQTLTKVCSAADRAVGACYGLALGDSFGAPFEFLPVDGRLVPPPRDNSQGYSNRSYELMPSRGWVNKVKATPFRPSHIFMDHLEVSREVGDDDRKGKMEITMLGEFNKFRLERGQWSDDTAMSLCLADSLLANKGYHGGDCRVRFFNWWCCRINNAFRFDDCRQNCDSVGLGGNISTSLSAIADSVGLHKTKDEVPEEVTTKNEDAGNGSMMRLAPLPIRFAKDPLKAMQLAAKHSRSTHPGSAAEACCTFMAHFIARTVTLPAHSSETPLRKYLEQEIAEYIKQIPKIGGMLPESPGMYRVRGVLENKPRDDADALWKWKEVELPTTKTLEARGEWYQGHPVDAGYFGAYSVDCLCMALWGLYQTPTSIAEHIQSHIHASEEQKKPEFLEKEKAREETFEALLERVINLRGDADTVAAVAGQFGGCFYGFQKISSGNEVREHMMSCIRKWDPFSEIGLRALMIADDGGLLEELEK